ncbi:hypothetical protein HN011_009851, partial [Eciton burchellii]
ARDPPRASTGGTPARLGGADDLVGLLDLGKSWASRDYITCAHPGQIDSKTSARSSSERSPRVTADPADRPPSRFRSRGSRHRSARKRSYRHSENSNESATIEFEYPLESRNVWQGRDNKGDEYRGEYRGFAAKLAEMNLKEN